MKKIAMYYTRPMEIGGVEIGMYNRAKLLSNMGYNVSFIYDNEDSSIDTLSKWSEVGNVYNYKYCNEEFDFAIYDSIYGNKRVNAKKYIQIINGCFVDGKEIYEESIPFDEYVAVSKEAGIQFKRLTGKDYKVIPNTIDAKSILKLSNGKYNIAKKKYNFVVVSRIDPVKGIDKLETFCKKIEEKTNDYQIIVVGSNDNYPEYVEEIKDLLSEYNVLFVGKQDNPYRYMKNADATVILSKFESQCLVLFESLIIGTPVITTDFPVAVDTVKNDMGIVLKQDLSNIDIDKILQIKKSFNFKYSTFKKDWKEVLKPYHKKDIKFSIIIPNYNNSKWLDKCLNSILNQTYKNYEIIFVDDMSTDNSIEIAGKVIGNKQPAMIIPLQQKRLNGGARNVGILEATGDYIMCIDSDDWLKHNKVLETLNKQIRNEDVAFLGFDMYDGENEGISPFIPNYNNLYEAFINNVCAIWTKVIKTSILKDTLMPEGTLAEDKVHHYRVVEKCNSFICIKESTHVWNRSNFKSVSTDRNELWEAGTIKHLAEMYLFIKRTNNQQYKQFVLNKFNQQKNNLNKGVYEQI